MITISSDYLPKSPLSFEKPRIRIGSDPRNDVVIKDASVKGFHAQVVQRSDGVKILSPGGAKVEVGGRTIIIESLSLPYEVTVGNVPLQLSAGGAPVVSGVQEDVRVEVAHSAVPPELPVIDEAPPRKDAAEQVSQQKTPTSQAPPNKQSSVGTWLIVGVVILAILAGVRDIIDDGDETPDASAASSSEPVEAQPNPEKSVEISVPSADPAKASSAPPQTRPTVDSDPTDEKDKVPVGPDLPVALNDFEQPTEMLRPDEKRGSVTDPEKGNEAETPKETAIAIGETFQLGDFSYTIDSAWKTRAIAGSRIEAAQFEAFEDELETNPEGSVGERVFYEMLLWQMKELGEGIVASDSAAFLIVRYEIKNEATTAKVVSTIDFTIVDYKNRQYSHSSAPISELTLNQEADFLFSELQPGIAREGVQAFVLPIDSFDEDLTLVVPQKGRLSSKKTSVVIPSETFHRGARWETKSGTQVTPADETEVEVEREEESVARAPARSGGRSDASDRGESVSKVEPELAAGQEREIGGARMAVIKGDLAKVNSKIESERARWHRATDVINTLTNFKRTPVREGSQAYYQCVEASKIITEVEQGAAALIAEKARLEAMLEVLEEQ